ncbi:MAG: class I SAM-dependent methyltransferase, partial [Vampirovibrionia bacterium]
KAYGIDIAENMVNSATENSKNYSNTEFLVSDFSKTPFNDNFFDVTLSVESIYYCEDMLETVKEVKRTLKKGGQFYCITYFFKEHYNSEVWADYVPLKMHYLSENEYKELFTNAGLSDIYTKRILDPRPVDRENFKPRWGYNTVEELINFKENIGALLVVGTNADR